MVVHYFSSMHGQRRDFWGTICAPKNKKILYKCKKINKRLYEIKKSEKSFDIDSFCEK